MFSERRVDGLILVVAGVWAIYVLLSLFGAIP